MIACPCGSQMHPDRSLCKVCSRKLGDALKSIADLWPESEVTLTRQGVSGSGSKVATGGKENPLPFDAHASEVRWDVENAVTTWCRDIADDDIPDGVHDVVTAALWLSQNAGTIATVPQGPEVFDELSDAARRLERLVDRRAVKNYLGHCPQCGEQVWAWPNDLYIKCQGVECEETIDLDKQRTRLRGDLEARNGTPAELSAMAKQMFDQTISPSMIRWYASEKRILPRGTVMSIKGNPVSVYLLADVLDVAADIQEAKARKQEEREKKRRQRAAM